MSVWEEPTDRPAKSATADLIDISFKLDCRSLPVDHAAALSHSVIQQIPWAADLPGTAVHPVHVAGSQNGWQRPENSDEMLLLSKRTRLRVRIKASHAAEVLDSLSNTALQVKGHQLNILAGTLNPLTPATNLFSRHTVYSADHDTAEDEENFIQRVIDTCNAFGYHPTKVLCGRSHHIATDDGQLLARSVLLADIPPEHSLRLQDNGLGDHRLMGCGILIPHKDTSAVN